MLGFEIVREDHDSDPWVARAQLAADDDSLVAVRRRHPQVGEHDIGTVCRNPRPHVVQARALGHVRDVGVVAQEPRESLAEEGVVLGEEDADRHTRS